MGDLSSSIPSCTQYTAVENSTERLLCDGFLVRNTHYVSFPISSQFSLSPPLLDYVPLGRPHVFSAIHSPNSSTVFLHP